VASYVKMPILRKLPGLMDFDGEKRREGFDICKYDGD